MAENTTDTTTPETVLTPDQVNALIPVFAWLTRAETPKGGSSRGTANYWSFVGGMRPSIATLVAVHHFGELKGDALIGEDLIDVPDLPDFPDRFVFTQKRTKAVARLTTLRHVGMHLLSVGAEHPLAQPAGVSVPDLAKWLKAADSEAMDRVVAEREAARKALQREAAGKQLEEQVKNLAAAIEVAENNGLDVTTMRAMLDAVKAQQASE